MVITKTRTEYLNAVRGLLSSKNPTCIEIGVENGNFSSQILDSLTPERLYLLDPWQKGYDKNSKTKIYTGELEGWSTAYSNEDQKNIIEENLKEKIKANQVILNQGYSYDFVDSYKDNYFDFIYIDACHIYESVKADLEMFLPKLKNEGLMCGHDYFNYSNFGVIKAVDEFCENFNFEMVIFNDQSSFGGFDWALKQK
jgi:hypothetical protein